MISLCHGQPLKIEESIIDCRIHTLIECYGTLPNALDCYKSDYGGLLCRFGETLLVSGSVDTNELLEFAELLGIKRIECLSNEKSLQDKLSDGWTCNSFPVLCYSGKGEPLSENVKTNIELRRCFSILCESDAQFAREAQYLSWLSDMTRRRNCKRTEAYLLEDCAVACVTAIGQCSAYLSSVAVIPDKRGKGLGEALVRAVASEISNKNLITFTAAQSEELITFYERAGFSAMPQFVIIAEKEKNQ